MLRNDVVGSAESAAMRLAFMPFSTFRSTLHPPRRDPSPRSISRRCPFRGLDGGERRPAFEAVSVKVEVTGEHSAVVLETDSSQSHIDIDKSSTSGLLRDPLPWHGGPGHPGSRVLRRRERRYHFQGAHSQQSYVVDGTDLRSDRRDASNSIDRGSPVDRGDLRQRPGGVRQKIAVINLTTKSGLAGAPKLEVGAALQYLRRGPPLAGGTSRFGYYASIDG